MAVARLEHKRIGTDIWRHEHDDARADHRHPGPDQYGQDPLRHPADAEPPVGQDRPRRCACWRERSAIGSSRAAPRSWRPVAGEERIVPERVQYWVATTEAMPEIAADFVAIDEIQLCADPERGHVFTDRLLHMRGIRRDACSWVQHQCARPSRPWSPKPVRAQERLSTLSWAGSKKLSRMPATQRDRGLQRRRRLCDGRADPSAEGWLRGRDGGAVAAHAQCPGRDVPERRGRLSGGHRRHRHGPEPGHQARGLQRHAQVRRQAGPPAVPP